MGERSLRPGWFGAAADSGRSSTKCMDTIARGGNTSFAFQVLRGLALDRGATTRREGARRSGWRLQHLPRAEEDDIRKEGHEWIYPSMIQCYTQARSAGNVGAAGEIVGSEASK